jgi:hypothetical protein
MNTPITRCLRHVAKNRRFNVWPSSTLSQPLCRHKSSPSPRHRGDHLSLEHDRSPTESLQQPLHAPLGAKTSLQASSVKAKQGAYIIEADEENASRPTSLASTSTKDSRTSIHVQWSDGATARYLATWLRDHDPQAMHETSQQRQSNSLAMVRSLFGACTPCDGVTIAPFYFRRFFFFSAFFLTPLLSHLKSFVCVSFAAFVWPLVQANDCERCSKRQRRGGGSKSPVGSSLGSSWRLTCANHLNLSPHLAGSASSFVYIAAQPS